MSTWPPTGSPRRSTRSWPGCLPQNSNQQRDRWIKERKSIMKNINWNELTPACYAIANANDVDVGVGGSMVHNNIRHGRAVDIGAENLPAAFRPDWAALGDGVDLAAENDEFNAWIRKRQGNVKALAALWNAKDYQGMIELMENAADPGPINGEKPSDHE